MKLVFKVDSSIISEAIQVFALANGYKWSSGHSDVRYTNRPILLFDTVSKDIYYDTCDRIRKDDIEVSSLNQLFELIKNKMVISGKTVKFNIQSVEIGDITITIQELSDMLHILEQK